MSANGHPQFVVDGQWIQPYRPGRGFLHQEWQSFSGGANQPLVKRPIYFASGGPGSFRMLRASTSSAGSLAAVTHRVGA